MKENPVSGLVDDGPGAAALSPTLASGAGSKRGREVETAGLLPPTPGNPENAGRMCEARRGFKHFVGREGACNFARLFGRRLFIFFDRRLFWPKVNFFPQESRLRPLPGPE